MVVNSAERFLSYVKHLGMSKSRDISSNTTSILTKDGWIAIINK